MLDLLDDFQAVKKEFMLVGNVGHLPALEKLAHRRIDRTVADWALERARLEDTRGN